MKKIMIFALLAILAFAIGQAQAQDAASLYGGGDSKVFLKCCQKVIVKKYQGKEFIECAECRDHVEKSEADEIETSSAPRPGPDFYKKPFDGECCVIVAFTKGKGGEHEPFKVLDCNPWSHCRKCEFSKNHHTAYDAKLKCDVKTYDLKCDCEKKCKPRHPHD